MRVYVSSAHQSITKIHRKYDTISPVPDFVVLVPFLVLFFGAIIATVAPRFSEPARRRLPIGILILALVAILVNAAPFSHRFELSSWDAALFSIALRLDGIAFVLLVAIFISLIALELVRPAASLDALSFYILLYSALLICAGNLLTTLFAWVFLDLALFAWRSARRLPHDAAMRALILGQLAGLALFAGAILLDAKQTQMSALLIALAFWARLGLFPFHWIFPNKDLQTLELTAIRGPAIAAGASLWVRWDELKLVVPSELIAWLAALTFLAAVVRIASEQEAMDQITAIVLNAIAFVPLAIAFDGASATALAFWVALSILFALAMFELGLVWQSDAQNRWARLFISAGILSLLGLPLTPAFLGRVGVYVSLIESRQWILFFLGVISATLAAKSHWQISASLRGAESREPTRVEYLGLQLLGLAFIVFGFGATLVAQVTGESADHALDLVVRTDDVLAVAIAFAALIASVAMSFILARISWGYHAQGEEIAQFAARVLDLDWLARGLTRLGKSVSALAHGLAALAEENPTVWILFAALWIAIFILTTR